MGITLYDGPHYIENCTFVNFVSHPCFDYINPAIGARAFNTFMMATTTFVRNSKFIETPYPVHILDRLSDGGKTTIVQDLSGSITGIARAKVVPDWDFYDAPNCVRNTSFGLACPHNYNNFEIIQVALPSILHPSIYHVLYSGK